MGPFTVAAVQAAYVLMDREATIDRVAALTAEAAGARGASRRVSRGLRARGPDLEGRRSDLGRRRRMVRDCSSTRRSSFRARRPIGSGPIAREHGVTYLAIGVDEREPARSTIYNTILYFGPDGALLGKHRKLMPDRLRAARVGDGRRLDAAGDRHAVRPGRRADLLGELHAAGAVRPVLAGGRHLAGADPGDGDGWVATHAPHRPGGPLLRRRRQPVPARGPDSGGLPATGQRCLAARSTTGPRGSSRATGDRRPRRAAPRGPGPARGDDPVRRGRPRRVVRPRGGTSTRPATTTARTCSGSRSTPDRGRRCPRSLPASTWTEAGASDADRRDRRQRQGAAAGSCSDLREHGHDVLNVDAAHDGTRARPDAARRPHGPRPDADALAGADAVVHLAAIPAPGLRPAGDTFRINALSTYNVFAAAEAHRVRRVVWASSETVLGLPFDTPPDFAPIDETIEPRPETLVRALEARRRDDGRPSSRGGPGSRSSACGSRTSWSPTTTPRFPSFWDDAQLRKWNLWGYVDARDVAAGRAAGARRRRSTAPRSASSPPPTR